jgi:dephospho-CoA kinase
MDKISREMQNPYAQRKLEREEDLKPEKLAKNLINRREKLEVLFKEGKLNRNDGGLGEEVDKLENYVLKNMTNELHKLSLGEIGELVEKFNLAYESETILVVAQLFDKERKKQ